MKSDREIDLLPSGACFYEGLCVYETRTAEQSFGRENCPFRRRWRLSGRGYALMKKLLSALVSAFLLCATSASANTGDELEAVVNSNVCPANLATYALPDYASAGCEDFTHGDNYDVVKANECMNEVDHESNQIIRYNSFVQRCTAEHASQPKDLSRDLLNKTASGIPGVAATNAMRMANLAAEQGWVSPSKAALIQSATKAYNTTDFMSDLYKLYDPSQSIQEKLRTLAGLVPDTAFANNLLAQDMLKTAIEGLTATSQTALESLVQELDTFSSEIAHDNEAAASRAIEQAKAEAARLARQRRLAEERASVRAAAERDRARQSTVAGPPPAISLPVRSSQPAVPACANREFNGKPCAAECFKPHFGDAPVEISTVGSVSECLDVCRHMFCGG
jgi:hypothetical protein